MVIISSVMWAGVTKRDTQGNKMLEKFSVLFEDKLGCCSYTVVTRVFAKAELNVFLFRRPPLHLRAQIETEMARNVKNGA